MNFSDLFFERGVWLRYIGKYIFDELLIWIETWYSAVLFMHVRLLDHLTSENPRPAFLTFETQIVALSRQTELLIITGWTLLSCSRDVVGNFNRTEFQSSSIERNRTQFRDWVWLISAMGQNRTHTKKWCTRTNQTFDFRIFYVCKTSGHKPYLKRLWRIKLSLTGVLDTGNHRRLDYQLLCSSSNTPLGGM